MYAVKNWNQFQHYSKRNPPWVKLHKKYLDDFDFHSLPVASRALAPLLWLLASEHKNPQSGFIDGPENKIAFRLHLTLEEFQEAITPLIDKGFIISGDDASTSLAHCQQDATPEYRDRDREQRHKEVFNHAKGNGHAKPKTGGEQGKRIADKIKRAAEAVVT